MTTAVHYSRFLATAWWLQLKQMTVNRLYVSVAVIQPVLIATVTSLMLRHSADGHALEQAALGSGVLGMWMATLLASGAAIARLRFVGTLEAVVASPAPLSLVVLPITFASATLGIYSLVVTMAWGRLLFGMPVALAHPAALLVAVPVLVGSLGCLGLLLAAVFVLYPNAVALSNVAGYPIAVLAGVIVPVSRIPQVLRPLSDVLAPRWGVQALQTVVLGGGSWSGSLLLCLATSAGYVGGALLLLSALVRRARRDAKLALT
ncbi:MAG TPA: ABC transporter permease [Actinospica sp.]|jgi:ABC-2 type transport system permease protein|nr:ABC transporter permease [Actinospica sp.]